MTKAEFSNLKAGDIVMRPTFRVKDGATVRSEAIPCIVKMMPSRKHGLIPVGTHASLGICANVNQKDWVLV